MRPFQFSMSYCGGLVVGGAVHDQRDLLTFRAVSETLLPNTSRLELSGPTITQSLIYKTVYTFLKYIKLLSPHCNIGYGQYVVLIKLKSTYRGDWCSVIISAVQYQR